MTFKTTSSSPSEGPLNRVRAAPRDLVAFLLLVLGLNACASAGPTLPESGTPSELARAYYDLVLADQAPPVRDLERRLVGTGAFAEPIGWTGSGKIFASVLAGTITSETVAMPRSPRRSGTGEVQAIEVRTLHATEVPDWFSYIGESRPGFASLVADRVWLDERVTRDTAVLAATLWHEYQHVRDRRHYRRLSPAILEARGAIRELTTGLDVRGLLGRLETARASGAEAAHYREAAERVMTSMALVLGASAASAPAIAAFGDEVVAAAADVLVSLAGM